MQRRSVEREQAPLPALSIQTDSCVLRTRSEPSIHPQKPLISNDPAEGTVARRLPKQPTDRTPARELPEDTSTMKVLRPVIGIASLDVPPGVVPLPMLDIEASVVPEVGAF